MKITKALLEKLVKLNASIFENEGWQTIDGKIAKVTDKEIIIKYTPEKEAAIPFGEIANIEITINTKTDDLSNYGIDSECIC